MQREDLMVAVACVGVSLIMLVMAVNDWLPGGGA